MKPTRLILLLGILTAQPLWAVYAPIPEQEQGKQFSVQVRAGVSHDSNIFGAPSGAISSMVYSFSPRFSVNSSLSDQTFFTGSYKLTIDNFTDRPGDKTLDSHEATARIAHAFSSDTNIDLSDTYTISKNPKSLLAGIPINTDQSFKRNQLDARLTTSLGRKIGGVIKFRTVDYSYDNSILAGNIDRNENVFGVEVNNQILPEVKLLGEYRHQLINYANAGGRKDKQSNFLIGGLEYNVARKISFTGRLGYEWRERDSERSSEAPYAEFSVKYDYAERSYLTAGYIYTFEETSNVALYTDTKVNRFFVNVQHSLTALIVVSGTINYEPSTLQGRIGKANADDKTTRLGLALTYLLNRNWTISATYDHDNVNSEDATRKMKRDRFGLNVALSF